MRVAAVLRPLPLIACVIPLIAPLESQASGLRLAAHAHGVDGIRAAVDGGADTIEHCSWVDQRGGWGRYEPALVASLHACSSAAPPDEWQVRAGGGGLDGTQGHLRVPSRVGAAAFLECMRTRPASPARRRCARARSCARPLGLAGRTSRGCSDRRGQRSSTCIARGCVWWPRATQVRSAATSRPSPCVHASRPLAASSGAGAISNVAHHRLVLPGRMLTSLTSPARVRCDPERGAPPTGRRRRRAWQVRARSETRPDETRRDQIRSDEIRSDQRTTHGTALLGRRGVSHAEAA